MMKIIYLDFQHLNILLMIYYSFKKHTKILKMKIKNYIGNYYNNVMLLCHNKLKMI